jgi:hypothetical protein
VWGLVALATGVLVAVGGFLDWARLEPSAIGTPGGTVPGVMQGPDTQVYGTLVFVSAGLLILAGLVRLVVRRSGRVPGVLAILGGLTALGASAYVLTSLETVFGDFAGRAAASPELSASNVKRLVSALLAAGEVSVHPGLGLILVVAGGGFGLLWGLIGLIRRASRPSSGRHVVAGQRSGASG